MDPTKDLVGKKVDFYVKTTDENHRPIILTKQVTVSGVVKGTMNQDVAYATLIRLLKCIIVMNMELKATQLKRYNS